MVDRATTRTGATWPTTAHTSARARRVVVTRYGGPDVLQMVEEDPPTPGPGEARVRILAAGVSYADLLMREGVHPEAPRPPFTLGWDLVGVVDQLGPHAEGVTPHQRVAALPITGGCADFICLPVDELVPVPPDVDVSLAAAIVLHYVTAYQMLYRVAHVQSGQRILVHGAAGGIGTALLELGHLVGLEMYGTGRAASLGAIAALGATPIDFERTDLEQGLTVGGLHDADDYERLLTYLQGLSVLGGLSVVSATPAAVTFRLDLRALPKYLDQSLAADGVVEWVESESQYRLLEREPDDG